MTRIIPPTFSKEEKQRHKIGRDYLKLIKASAKKKARLLRRIERRKKHIGEG